MAVPLNSPASTSGELLDPVAAYDRVAPVYARLAEQRKAYLDAVDRLVAAEIPPGSRSLLDAGAGYGARASRIAQAAGVRHLVLLEPSVVMRSHCPAEATIWAMRAEDLHCQEGSFDVITCLWNVLGHILPFAARGEVLRQFARLASPAGRIFVDVNHRYNARHYGALATAKRFLWDRISPGDGNGDVTVAWNIDGNRCATIGHVFTQGEFTSLSRAAGLSIEKRLSSTMLPDNFGGGVLRATFCTFCGGRPVRVCEPDGSGRVQSPLAGSGRPRRSRRPSVD